MSCGAALQARRETEGARVRRSLACRCAAPYSLLPLGWVPRRWGFGKNADWDLVAVYYGQDKDWDCPQVRRRLGGGWGVLVLTDSACSPCNRLPLQTAAPCFAAACDRHAVHG